MPKTSGASGKKPTRDVNVKAAKKTTASKKSTSSADERYNKQKQENERLKEEIRTLKDKRTPAQKAEQSYAPYILFFLGIFLLICLFFKEQTNFFGWLSGVFSGLLSFGLPAIALCLIVEAFTYRSDVRNNRVVGRVLLLGSFVLEVSSFFHLIYRASLNAEEKAAKVSIVELYSLGKQYKGGGIVGGAIASLLEKIMGVGAWFVIIIALILTVAAMFRLTLPDLVAMAKERSRIAEYNARMRQKESLERRSEEYAEPKREEQLVLEEVGVKKEKKHPKISVKEPVLPRKKPYLEGLGDDAPADSSPSQPEPQPSSADKHDDDDLLMLTPDALRKATAGSYPASGSSFGSVPETPAAKPQYDNTPAAVSSFVPASDPESDEALPETGAAAAAEANETPKSEILFNDKPADKEQSVRSIDIGDIFAADAKINVAGMTANTSDVLPEGSDGAKKPVEIAAENAGEKEDVKVESKPDPAELYKFPSLDFLTKDPNPATFTVTEEVRLTSVKLVETLATFGVKTKITDICCGPTVTRYELQPEIGVRVKAIQNLADDIALHLAAKGVRIEAPIPGKQAVGIEIPNSTVSTVYLRNLIENPRFEQQKSKLAVCLGMDVAGSPVYVDLAKMPHLLIAGATGMGKSVCINSFIVSLLYKARPDECKLMLIDPKKVEFALYNGMPHLLVPVVSDPKKAAGALSWAVNEMERRFQLLEEVGVRDLTAYNKAVEKDPEREVLPKIVIIIDELADLMMTARDSVENSICRIAQKARAAGMHLVIGTQRPSVDVVTGLIKANVPSRICCTVASQVDSRTVIDIAGAEKLLGKGDMLYAPVGCMKPMRVQGSFVEEKEIEPIVEYLKSIGEVSYDDNIERDIEREAERCTEKKRGRGGDAEDEGEPADSGAIMDADEAMWPALEIAIDAGQISTSLLQRKLSLGYSRAARIVDNLEKLGYISAFEGSKPRRVLITREEYLRMRSDSEQ